MSEVMTVTHTVFPNNPVNARGMEEKGNYTKKDQGGQEMLHGTQSAEMVRPVKDYKTDNEREKTTGTDSKGSDFNTVLRKKMDRKEQVECEEQGSSTANAVVEQGSSEDVNQVNVPECSEKITMFQDTEDSTGEIENSPEAIVLNAGITVSKEIAAADGKGSNTLNDTATDKPPMDQPSAGTTVKNPDQSVSEQIPSDKSGRTFSQETVVEGKTPSTVQTKDAQDPANTELRSQEKGKEQLKETISAETTDKTPKEMHNVYNEASVKKEASGTETQQAKGTEVLQSATQSKLADPAPSQQNQNTDSGTLKSNASKTDPFNLSETSIKDESQTEGKKADTDLSAKISGKVHEMAMGGEINSANTIGNTAKSMDTASVNAMDAAPRLAAAREAVLAEKPAEQIIQHINTMNLAGPQQHIRITLTPAELGTIRITFSETNGEIFGTVEAQKDQTRREVQEAMPQILSALQDNGVQVRRIEVTQWDNNPQTAKDQSSNGFDPAAEREFAQQNSSGSRTSEGENSRYSTGQAGRMGRIGIHNLSEYNEKYQDKGLNLYI